jgi:hypothetical protein
MTRTRSQAALALALTLLVGLGLAACSKAAGDDAPAAGAAFATNPPKTTPPTTPPIGAECSQELVAAAAGVKYPNAKISDRFCTSTFAIATMFPAGGPKAGIVGFFTAANNAWVLVAETSPGGDIGGAAPTGFPDDLVKSWKGSYVDPTKATTTTLSVSSDNHDCSADGGKCNESTTTTTAKTTTTTSKSSTTTATSPASSPPSSAKTTTTTAASTGIG